jgi:fluoroquinolone resistance protein
MPHALAGEHIDAIFEDLERCDQVVRGAVFEGCRFVGCRLEELSLLDCRFLDCRFEGCDLVGVKLAGSTMIDVRFRGGRAMGVDWSSLRTLMLGLGFEGVRMDYASFSGLPLLGTVFRDCGLREAAFLSCDLSRASFTGCDLAGARLQDCDLVGTDLSGARGCEIHAGSCRTRATKVELGTALHQLAQLGVHCPELEG